MSTEINPMTPKCPPHLSGEARGLWRDIHAQFEIDSATKLLFVAEACRALDRLRQAQKSIREHGLTTSGRYGQRVLNPAVGVERTARAALMQSLKQIGFEGQSYV